MPSSLLRRRLGIVDLRQGRFLDAAGELLGFYFDSQAEDQWNDPWRKGVLIRRDLFQRFLGEEGLAACWGVYIERRPQVFLFQRHWLTKRFDWYGICLLEEGQVDTFEALCTIEEILPGDPS